MLHGEPGRFSLGEQRRPVGCGSARTEPVGWPRDRGAFLSSGSLPGDRSPRRDRSLGEEVSPARTLAVHRFGGRIALAGCGKFTAGDRGFSEPAPPSRAEWGASVSRCRSSNARSQHDCGGGRAVRSASASSWRQGLSGVSEVFLSDPS